MMRKIHRIYRRIAPLLTVALLAAGLLLVAAAPSRADEPHRDHRESEVRRSVKKHRNVTRDLGRRSDRARHVDRVRRIDQRVRSRTVLRSRRVIRGGPSRSVVRHDHFTRDGHTRARVVRHQVRFDRRAPGRMVIHHDRDRFIRLGRSETFFRHGRFYHHRRGGYLPAPEPIGAFILNLPLGSVRITVGDFDYWRFDGVYFQAAPGGWVVASPPLAVQTATPPPVLEGTIIVDVPALNVRTGPGLGFSVINQAGQGEELIVEGQAPGWYYVRLPGQGDGWVMARYTQPSPQG
jgi:hypothetical protein